jgi:hypothetical protein
VIGTTGLTEGILNNSLARVSGTKLQQNVKKYTYKTSGDETSGDEGLGN